MVPIYEKARKQMCVIHGHDMMLAVKVMLNPNTISETRFYYFSKGFLLRVIEICLSDKGPKPQAVAYRT